MKKIIILILLFVMATFTLDAQTYVTNAYENKISQKPLRPNTIYAVFQPIDYGFGFRYDRMFSNKWGSYIAMTHGEYNFDTDNGVATIDNHYKVVSGVLVYLKPEIRDYGTALGIGLSYNTYDGLYNIPTEFPSEALNPWSFEVSCTARIATRFNLSVRFDPIKWESGIDVGFSF